MKSIASREKQRNKLKREPEVLKKLVGKMLLVLFLSAAAGLEPLEPSVGKPSISINQDKDGNYQLFVGAEPFLIKGVCYTPIPIGKSYAYDFWQQDFEIFKADGQLMKEMGANVIRVYQSGPDIKRTKEVINFFYQKFGIRTVMGNWLGFWDGSFPDYANREFRDKVKRQCLAMVNEFKDEPAILLWVLGNENNFSFGRQKLRRWTSPELEKIADPMAKQLAQARIYYKFVNEVAAEIKKIDRVHPVALGNGGLDFIEIAREHSSHLDLLACSLYSGKSFSSVFRQAKNNWQKPLFFSEVGCDSFNALTGEPDEETQAEFLKAQWNEIKKNFAQGRGEGNCLGAAIFEWVDEWWKADEFDQASWSVHDQRATWSHGAYYFDIAAPQNLNMNEEWWGIVKQAVVGGQLLRTPKKAYYILQELWKER